MVRRLINERGYSKDLVKVLLGGWGTWKENNAKDPKGYPMNIGKGTAPGAGNPPGVVIITPASNDAAQPTPKP